MGLDMYAYTTPSPIPDVDFEMPDDAGLFACWRKHPNLHGWMEQLYRQKGGCKPDFDCDTVRLDPVDIDALEILVLSGSLPFTTGFFFGQSQPEHKNEDVAFIASAREAFADGLSVFYYAWW